MKIFGIEFFKEEISTKKIKILSDFLEKLSKEDIKKIFTKNSSPLLSIKPYSHNFDNLNLHKEINLFFSLYKEVVLEHEYKKIIFSHDLIKRFEYEDDYYIIGKVDDINILVKKLTNCLEYEDALSDNEDNEEVSIYFFLLMDVLYIKYKDILNLKDFEVLLQKELK